MGYDEIGERQFLELMIRGLAIRPSGPNYRLLFLYPRELLLSNGFPVSPSDDTFARDGSGDVAVVYRDVSFLVVLCLFLFGDCREIVT